MVIPNLHDGYFDGVWLSESKDARLFVRSVTGERSTIVLSGVEAMNIRNLRAGNIILDLVLVSHDALTAEHLAEAHDLQGTHRAKADELRDRARQQRLSAIEVNPSYGAQGIVIFRTGEIVSGHRVG